MTRVNRVALSARLAALRICALALLPILFPPAAVSTEAVAEATDAAHRRLVITITETGLYLCGVGHGGLYGCVDEAISRRMEAVRIHASHRASTESVQALLRAVHAEGFVVELDHVYD